MFISRRCIHDNFMLVDQMMRYLHRLGEPCTMLKLDIRSCVRHGVVVATLQGPARGWLWPAFPQVDCHSAILE